MLIQKDLLSIGEVAQVTGIPVHTIRFWESEFDRFISPARTTGRQRRYSEAEVNRILEIRKLLKEDKYSIAGAKQVLSTQSHERRGSLSSRPDQEGGSRSMIMERSNRDAVFPLADMSMM